MTFTATYDGHTLTPTEPLALPIGTPVQVTVAGPPDATLELLREWGELPADEDWPADGAATCKPHHRRTPMPS